MNSKSLNTNVNDTLLTLRRELHQYPELSGEESKTAQRIQDFITKHHPTKIIKNLGGYGFAAVYNNEPNKPTIAIRCELDALPIEEKNTFDHKSKIKGVSHKCGHDGHMTIVSGLLFWLKEQQSIPANIILLFQSAEETGKGAYEMLADERFDALNIDYVFALHNIPQRAMHEVIISKNSFSAEVQSFAIKLIGKESHAAEPENGINPSNAISKLITELDALNTNNALDENFTVLTPVYINVGQKSYGISPANGELHYTIRTWSPEKMTQLKSTIEKITTTIAQKNALDFKIDWFEYFPATQNDDDCNNIIQKAASACNLTIYEKPHPFKFGEDFGWFSKKYKTAMFGLGSGINIPVLHNAHYDFPHELIETGLNMFKAIISNIIEEQ